MLRDNFLYSAKNLNLRTPNKHALSDYKNINLSAKCELFKTSTGRFIVYYKKNYKYSNLTLCYTPVKE